MVRAVRACGSVRGSACTAVLFLSTGDDMAGSVFDEILHEPAALTDDSCVHASYRLYAAAGLDAAVLGNHDCWRPTSTLRRFCP